MELRKKISIVFFKKVYNSLKAKLIAKKKGFLIKYKHNTKLFFIPNDQKPHFRIYQNLHLIAISCENDLKCYSSIKKFLIKGILIPQVEKNSTDFLIDNYLYILENHEKLLFSSLKIYPIDYREIDFFERFFTDKPKIITITPYQYCKIVEYGRYYIYTKDKAEHSVLLFGILIKVNIFNFPPKLTKPKKLQFWMDFLDIPQEKRVVRNDLINIDPISHPDAMPKLKEIYDSIYQLELPGVKDYFDYSIKANHRVRASIIE